MQTVLSLSLLLAVAYGATVAQNNDGGATMDEATAMQYFMDYGYAGQSNPNPEIADLMTDDPPRAMQVAYMIFQHKFGLNVTGELDEPTATLMSMTRCGNKDISTMEDMMPMDSMENGGSSGRKRRYLVQGRRWPNDRLTYRVTQYPRDNDLTQSQVDSEIERAFEVWSDVTPLTFVRSSGNVDIYIQFEAYDHGDGNAFDGPGGVLAHAYLPSIGREIEGDSHFDESETWTLNAHSGTNLFQVAAHEFGHALGLGHSEIQSALMAPFYRGYIPDFRLPMDDILGIQSLYGKRVTGGRRTTTTTTTRAPRTFPPNMPNFCEDSHIDAITSHMENGQTMVYVFQGDYFTILQGGIAPGYPKAISSEWRGLPNNIDAALYLEPYERDYYVWSWEQYRYNKHTESSPAYTLFFKGDNYYLFTEDRTPDANNPRRISELGMPRDIDASFVWARNGRIYVTKGSQYYRYTRQADPVLTMDAGYPRALSVWNLPVSSIDEGFQNHNGHNFFFKDQQYYLYDNTNVEVATGYPRSNSEGVFRCSRNFETENNEAGNGDDSDMMNEGHRGDVGEEEEDDMSSAADTQTVSYVTFMSINCLMTLAALCLL